MPDYKLDLIKRYCDTTGHRLSNTQKDLLCMILENPGKYDGYTSIIYTTRDSGRDYRDTWDSTTQWQYRINIYPTLSIDERYRHECDCVVNDEHWDWRNAWHYTDIKKIISILHEIEPEL